jgi:hypothetical protein
MVDGFNDSRDLVHERDCTSDVIKHGNFAHLLPRKWDVFEEFHDSMRNILQSSKVNAFIVTELAITHVTVILDDFTDVLWREILSQQLSSTIA